jgi:predicted ATPase
MATDLEIGTETGEPALARPSLKITGLHIRGLKSIGSLDLPGDGLGWDGPIPDFVMVGGINGSGKTTLLEFIIHAFDYFSRTFDLHDFQDLPAELRAVEACIDLRFRIPGLPDDGFRFLIGDKSFLTKNAEGMRFEFDRISSLSAHRGRFQYHDQAGAVLRLENRLFRAKNEENYRSPTVVYFPSEGRNLVIPETSYKMPGNLTPSDKFVQSWQRPMDWKDSLPARLYALRWEDLNAKEEGRPEEATHFQSYQLAFNRFFEGRKRLKWTPKGELVVETKGGDIHDLSELSSGEKQVILFMGELLHRWRPGSLILIDEPELHLHESYQTKLWESLVDWQKERGGQVIVATQSGHLFGLSGPGTRVILSNRRSR